MRSRDNFYHQKICPWSQIFLRCVWADLDLNKSKQIGFIGLLIINAANITVTDQVVLLQPCYCSVQSRSFRHQHCCPGCTLCPSTGLTTTFRQRWRRLHPSESLSDRQVEVADPTHWNTPTNNELIWQLQLTITYHHRHVWYFLSTTRNTLDCDQSNVYMYSSCILLSSTPVKLLSLSHSCLFIPYVG